MGKGKPGRGWTVKEGAEGVRLTGQVKKWRKTQGVRHKGMDNSDILYNPVP